ncbi:uncharacterized protein RHO25_009146 [Cercospora beticola]|uniref:Uncharacterized protein n=1 Tax=Cercospora beticola TaxID=122368 RepID=A0ABZ0NYP3_CERBT|nr:hypothetical protein RHO25_009146 [Cercospora beticola]CAK1364243.1 unnamed protein product [Cercospora beticola]
MAIKASDFWDSDSPLKASLDMQLQRLMTDGTAANGVDIGLAEKPRKRKYMAGANDLWSPFGEPAATPKV